MSDVRRRDLAGASFVGVLLACALAGCLDRPPAWPEPWPCGVADGDRAGRLSWQAGGGWSCGDASRADGGRASDTGADPGPIPVGDAGPDTTRPETMGEDGPADDVRDAAETEEGGCPVPALGVCGDHPAPVVPRGDDGLCDFGAIEGWESDEQSCDGRDNDCDGAVDEGLCAEARAQILELPDNDVVATDVSADGAGSIVVTGVGRTGRVAIRKTYLFPFVVSRGAGRPPSLEALPRVEAPLRQHHEATAARTTFLADGRLALLQRYEGLVPHEIRLNTATLSVDGGGVTWGDWVTVTETWPEEPGPYLDVARLSDGRLVVAWTESVSTRLAVYDVPAGIRGGALWTGEVSQRLAPGLASGPEDARFVLATQTSGRVTIAALRPDPLTPEVWGPTSPPADAVLVESEAEAYRRPDVASLSDGRAVIVRLHRVTGPEEEPVAVEVRLATATPGLDVAPELAFGGAIGAGRPGDTPAVLALSDHEVVVLWASPEGDELLARRVDVDDRAADGSVCALQTNGSYTAGPRGARLADGRLFVVWSGVDQGHGKIFRRIIAARTLSCGD